MGLSIEPGHLAPVSSLDAPDGLAAPKTTPAARVGMGPTPTVKRQRSIGSAMFGFFATAVAAALIGAGFSNTAQAQARAPTAVEVQDSTLRAGYQRLIAADKDGDKKWIGTRYGNELVGLDPVAQAIFDYIDYINPRAQASLWGAATAGDYQEGGLGLGYSMRPKHMTTNRFLLEADFEPGMKRLELALANPLGNDQVGADIKEMLLKMMGGDEIERLTRIHDTAETLLDLIVKQTGRKEVATRSSTALLTEPELLALLTPGTMHRLIAETASGHGPVYFANALEVIGANGRALGLPPRTEVGVVGEAQQQYLLQIAKRAMEAKLVAELKAAL